MKSRGLIQLVMIGIGIGLAAPAGAQSIRAEISSTNAELSEVLELYVTLVNPSQASAPAPPETTDFDIRLISVNPSQSSRMTVIGGQVTQEQSYTYRYRVRPLREGNLTIPSFSYKDKGQTYQTKPISVSIGQSKAGPFVICEIEVDSEVAYIGQPVLLRMKIFIRQFNQQGYGTLDADLTWRLRDTRNIKWGVFSEVNLVPSVQQVRRKDDSGVERDFYKYMLETTVYPSKAGPFDFGEIEFIYQYPIQLSRSLLGYQLERARRISVEPEPPNLTIVPIPTKGRPPDFNGAIGIYTIFTTAKPTEAPVGDPITLTLSLRGDGTLDRLTPPRLDQVEELRKDFEISGDIPAGRIEGDRKIFNVTIRPLREDVRQIPAIPLSYFNPKTERFETAMSRPIPIKVLPAVRLALPGPAESGAGYTAGSLTPLVETTAGLLPNYTDPTQVLASQTSDMGVAVWFLLAALPIAYLVTWIVQARSAKFRNNEALRRRSLAHSSARRALAGGDNVHPGQIRGAVLSYIADCCNVPAGGLTRNEAVRLASTHGMPPEITARLDAIIEQLEYAEYGGVATTLDSAPAGREVGHRAMADTSGNASAATQLHVAQRALSLINEMEKCGFR